MGRSKQKTKLSITRILTVVLAGALITGCEYQLHTKKTKPKASVESEAPTLNPQYIELSVGVSASASYLGSGGVAPYSYSTLSGPGSTHSSSGLYSSSISQRHVGETTTVRVTDSANKTADAIIKHGRFAVNGLVRTAVSDGTSLYVGGSFTAANFEPARGFAQVDPTTGASVSRTLASSFNGTISAIQFSGDNAYVGGSFTSYRGISVQHLVKINWRTGELDTTFTQSTGFDMNVTALVLSGSSLFVGGNFTTYRGDNRAFLLAKLDTTTGELDTVFNSTAGAGPNGAPSALALDGSSLFIGGGFTLYRGDTRGFFLAKVDTTTGNLDTTFNSTAGSGPNNIVNAIVVSGSSLYLGGNFTSYRGDTKGYRLAKVDTTNGNLDTTFNSTASAGPSGSVFTLALSGTSLYVGGNFTAYRGDNKGYYLAKVDASTGALDTTFNSTASTGPSNVVMTIVVSGSSLYIGGGFTAYRGDNKGYYLVKVDGSSGVMDTTFNSASYSGPNAQVNTLAYLGSSLFVGGSFTTYRTGTRVQNLAKFDLTTGQLDTTFTQSTGPDNTVWALALSGSSLYVGGNFTSYRGDSRGYYIAKVDTTSGALDSGFNSDPNTGPNAMVTSLAVSGSNLYLGGSFTSYRADTRGNSLIKVNSGSGVLDTTFNSTTAGPNGSVSTILISGSSLFVGGSFSQYRGDAKGAYLAKVDTTSGNLDATFNSVAGPNAVVSAITISGSSLYVGGNFTTYRTDGAGYRVAKLDTTSGAMDTAFNSGVNVGPNGAVNSLYLSGSSLFVGGNFSLYRGDSNGICLAKASASTGAIDTTFNTTSSGPSAQVYTLANGGSSIYAGGNFPRYRGSSLSPYLVSIDSATGVEK